MPLSARYCGGLIVPGIPARDLAAEEWQALPAALRAALVAQGAYEEIDDTPADEPGDEEDTDDGSW